MKIKHQIVIQGICIVLLIVLGYSFNQSGHYLFSAMSFVGACVITYLAIITVGEEDDEDN